jgi:DNA-binding transcriptional regulator GbsR (MarR family)
MENRAGRVGELNPVEAGGIQLFVAFSRTLGQPAFIAEICGLLFISSRPLTIDDLMERLRLSNGSASQGLKYLRDMGAARIVEAPGGG